MASVGHDCRHLGGGWGGERNSTQQNFLATTTTQSVFCVVVLFVLSAQSCSLLLSTNDLGKLQCGSVQHTNTSKSLCV